MYKFSSTYLYFQVKQYTLKTGVLNIFTNVHVAGAFLLRTSENVEDLLQCILVGPYSDQVVCKSCREF